VPGPIAVSYSQTEGFVVQTREPSSVVLIDKGRAAGRERSRHRARDLPSEPQRLHCNRLRLVSPRGWGRCANVELHPYRREANAEHQGRHRLDGAAALGWRYVRARPDHG
jgi:hypothetical protein